MQSLERVDHDDELGLVELTAERSLDAARASESRAASEAVAPSVLDINADITPEELRNVEIRESFRGYHRTAVDALCDRAAETIERLLRQRSLLEERLESLKSGDGLQRATAHGAPQPGAYEISPETAREIDVIQRTLALAQRAADEALAEAEERARAMTSDAEAKARALVSTAESEARRIANAEQRRVAAEVAELTSRREVLRADVDKLEHFAADYRDRLRRAIDAEVERLGASAVAAVAPPPAPELLGQIPALASLDPGAARADFGEAPGI